MNPFINQLCYKIWLVNFLYIDCDVMKLIKKLIHSLSLNRVIKALPIKDLRANKFTYINEEGIVFHHTAGIYKISTQDEISTYVYSRETRSNIIGIRYCYQAGLHSYELSVDFKSSYYDSRKIKELPEFVDQWTWYRYPKEFNQV